MCAVFWPGTTERARMNSDITFIIGSSSGAVIVLMVLVIIAMFTVIFIIMKRRQKMDREIMHTYDAIYDRALPDPTYDTVNQEKMLVMSNNEAYFKIKAEKEDSAAEIPC